MIQQRLEQVIKNLQVLEQSVDSRSVAKGILADIETLKDISRSLAPRYLETYPSHHAVRAIGENYFLSNSLQRQVDGANFNEAHPSRSFYPATRYQELKEIIDSFKSVVKVVWLNDAMVQSDKIKTTSDRNVDVAQFVKDTLDVAVIEKIDMKSLITLHKHGEKVKHICTVFVQNAIDTTTMSFTNYSKLAAYIYDFKDRRFDGQRTGILPSKL